MTRLKHNTCWIKIAPALLVFLLCFIVNCPAQHYSLSIKWHELPAFPRGNNNDKGRGLAGLFSGVDNDVLIIAGGTNFPDGGRPWNGSRKKWYDDIYVLRKNNNGKYVWLDTVFKLPRPLAYGAAVSTKEGVVCIGGQDTANFRKEVWLLKWNRQKQTVEIEQLPDLPVSLAYMSAAVLDGSIYVVGGEQGTHKGIASHSFFKLDLAKRNAWELLTPWPGPGRVMPVAAVQNNGTHNCLYVFSGRQSALQGDSLLFDGYCYDPATLLWKRLNNIGIQDQQAWCMAGASSAPVGLNHIMVFGGADSRDHRLFRKAQLNYDQATDAGQKEQYRQTLNNISDHHTGYSRDIYTYHTLTDRWVKVGTFPFPSPVVTQATLWDKDIIIPGGEIAPAKRSAAIWSADVVVNETSILKGFDYALIIIYFLTIFYIGYKYKRKVKTTNDYYKAGGRIPGWASGVAMFGSLLSAITFLTTPAKTYNENWMYFLPTLSSLIVAPLIVAYIVPVYLKLNVTTAYEYLEKRFSPIIRLMGSLSFLSFHVAKFGIMLLLPALAISVITGIDPMTCIIVIGLFSTVYGTLGGIEAVVWTEVLQVFIFLTAALLSMMVVVLKLHGGLGEILAVNENMGKFEFVNWHFSFSEITIFVAISYWIGGGMVPYIADQTVIQRYLVTKDIKSASRGVWVNGILIALSSVMFFFIGSALFAYYWSFPEKLNPTLPTPESVYPWFIINELPSGIRGLVIAGIFAVAMSTVSSTMNSMSATAVTDLVRFSKNKIASRRQLIMAKVFSAFFGLAGTLIAAMMFIYEVGSLWDMIRRITGLLTGGLAGLFLLGMFTKKANHIGALAGFIISAFVQYYISLRTPIHFMMYSLTGMLSCFITGYIVSLFFNSPKIEHRLVK